MVHRAQLLATHGNWRKAWRAGGVSHTTGWMPDAAGPRTAGAGNKMGDGRQKDGDGPIEQGKQLTKEEQAAEKKRMQVEKKQAMEAERQRRKKMYHFEEKSFCEKVANWRLVPNTRLYTIWELLIIAAVLWVAIALPFNIGFGLVEEDMWSFAIIMEYGTDQLFMIDVALQFFTAYVDKWGNLHKNRRSIARRYVKGYFLIDFVAAIPFDYFLTSGAVKKLAMIKGIRLLRIFKVFKFLDKYKSSNIWKIFRLFAGFMLFAHWIGCFWWYIGVNWSPDAYTGSTWVEGAGYQCYEHPDHGTFASPMIYEAFLEDTENCKGCAAPGAMKQAFLDGLTEEGVGCEANELRFRYVRSLYWALTTITSVGYGDICPGTRLETIVGIFVELVGAAFYATIFSNMAVYVASLDAVHNQYIEEVQSIQEQMIYLKLPRSIFNKVENYYEYLYLRHKSLLEEDDYFYRQLPAPLEREVCMHLFQHSVEKVHLFHGCSIAFVRELVTKLKPQICIPHEYVINRGDPAKFMFFIARGSVDVLTDLGGEKLGELHEGDYFGEMAVLQSTLRTCSVRTRMFCDLYHVEADCIQELLHAFPKDKKLVLHNALRFFTDQDGGEEENPDDDGAT